MLCRLRPLACRMALPLLLLLPACRERASLDLVIAVSDRIDAAALAGSIELDLLDANTGQTISSAELAAPTSGDRLRAFDTLDLIDERRYVLRVSAPLATEADCPSQRLIGFSAPFPYGEALDQVSIVADCADGSSLLEGPREARVFHSATWLPSPAPSGQVLIVGGVNQLVDTQASDVLGAGVTVYDTTLRYDPDTNRIRELSSAQLDPPRYLHTATRISDENLVIVGGIEAKRRANRTELDLSSRRVERFQGAAWSGLPGLEIGRGAHGAALLAPNRLAVSRGASEAGLADSSVEVYDPIEGESEGVLQAGTGLPRLAPQMLAFPTRQMALLIGGVHLENLPTPHDLLCFGSGCGCTPPCAERVTGFAAGQGRLWLSATHVRCTAGSDDGAIYLIGGQLGGGGALVDEIRCLEATALNTSAGPELVGRLPEARSLHTTTLVRGPGGGQRLLVAGGISTRSTVERTAWLFPVGCTCTRVRAREIQTIQLREKRAGHTATELPDGSVLFVGGFSAIEAGSAELLPTDPERFVPDA